MMRVIQGKIQALPGVKAVAVKDNIQDDKAKFAGDPRTGKGSPFYKTLKSFQLDTLEEGKNFAKSYQQTSFGKAMDDNNKKVANIMNTQGMESAVEHMFKHPETGKPIDYATMRCYYG